MEKFRFLDLRLFYWECYFVYVDGGCVSKLIFTPEMFLVNHGALTPEGMANIAQKAFDEWLEKQKVVYYSERKILFYKVKEATHRGYLVCMEEIKGCEHRTVVNDQDMSGRRILDLWRCRDCNKQLKPKNGWEEI